MPGKRNKYTAQFKLAVITYAENSNNSAAGREYGVSEKLVRDWRKVSTRLFGSAATCPKTLLVYKSTSEILP